LLVPLSAAYKVTRSRTLTSSSREQTPSLTHGSGRWMRSADGPFYGDGGGNVCNGNTPNIVMKVTEKYFDSWISCGVTGMFVSINFRALMAI